MSLLTSGFLGYLQFDPNQTSWNQQVLELRALRDLDLGERGNRCAAVRFGPSCLDGLSGTDTSCVFDATGPDLSVRGVSQKLRPRRFSGVTFPVLDEAQWLRPYGVPTEGGTDVASPDTIRTMPPEMLFDYLSVRLNGPKATAGHSTTSWDCSTHT